MSRVAATPRREQAPAGEIIVDAPRHAGKDDQNAAPVELRAVARGFRPREQYRAGEDCHRTSKYSAIDILPKNKPGDRHRGEALGIEQQGAGRSGRERQARHKQGRSENAAEQHDRGKPRQVACAQRRLGPPKVKRTVSYFDQREARTGAEIKQPGEQQRIGDADEQLRNRGAGAKQEREASASSGPL
jgi:hypothetical protein